MALQNFRRTARVLLEIPIEVLGKGSNGHPFEEKTFTEEVNGHGAQIVLRNSPRQGDRLTITNLRNRMSCEFRVVKALEKAAAGGREYGVECLQPEENMWGIYFPEVTSPPSPAREKLIDALLECQRCGSREMAQLTFNQFKILGGQSILERECMKCGKLTEWGYGYVEEEEVPPVKRNAPSSTQPPPGGIEKRKSKRVTVKLPVRIRLVNGQEDVAPTENLSKTGVRFISKLKMNVGEALRLTVGYAGPGTGIEIPAQVVNRQELEGTNRFIYGVRVEESSVTT